MPNPLCSNFVLDTLLRGIHRDKTIQVKQALPITPELPLKVRSLLDLSASYWATLLKTIDNHYYIKRNHTGGHKIIRTGVPSNQLQKNYSIQGKMCLYSTVGDC